MAESFNIQQVNSDLQEAGAPWVAAETSMTRLSEEQRVRRLGFTPPPGELSVEEASIQFKALEEAGQLDDIAASFATESIGAPAAYDLRDVNGRDYTTSVKNQGGCGSCVAFASSAVLETSYRRFNPNQDIDVSEAHLFYCHGKEEGRNCGNGWWPEKAFDKVKAKGLTLEQFFPYTPGDQSCNLASGYKGNMVNFGSMEKLDSTSKMKDWISTRGSITGCFIVYDDFFSYSGGIYKHVSGEQRGGHCVEIIGYNNAERYWLCKNSWGTNWGDNGYFKIAYGQCRIEDWAGPYGVAGVSLLTWRNNLACTGLWTNSSAKNAYASFDNGVGWRKLANSSEIENHAMLAALAAAKASNRKVNIHDDNGKIRTCYA